MRDCRQTASVGDYIELCKPRVVALLILTAIIAMLLASPTTIIPWKILIFGSLGITMASCSGGVINHLIDRRIDAMMARTQGRPIASGRIKPLHAMIFALLLAIGSMILLISQVNTMTAILSLLALIGYAVIYTLFLKRATPQNIVIGGLAGAMPPLLGWTCVTGYIDPNALLLVLIIFAWTPPHFWALAIYRNKDYAKANIPMLPVTHGLAFTRLFVLLYSILLTAITYLPYVTGMCGLVFLIGVSVLNALFLYHAIRLYKTKMLKHALATFHFSIIYLGLLFITLLIDHYFPVLIV